MAVLSLPFNLTNHMLILRHHGNVKARGKNSIIHIRLYKIPEMLRSKNYLLRYFTWFANRIWCIQEPQLKKIYKDSFLAQARTLLWWKWALANSFEFAGGYVRDGVEYNIRHLRHHCRCSDSCLPLARIEMLSDRHFMASCDHCRKQYFLFGIGHKKGLPLSKIHCYE